MPSQSILALLLGEGRDKTRADFWAGPLTRLEKPGAERMITMIIAAV